MADFVRTLDSTSGDGCQDNPNFKQSERPREHEAMSFTSKIFGMLEAELDSNLSFVFRIASNLTNPGSKEVKPHDTIRVKVLVRNSSDLPLILVQGTIQPALVAEFRPTSFSISNLPPHQLQEIAQIKVRVGAWGEGQLLDDIGTVTVAANADLSGLQFQEWDKPLTRDVRKASDVGPKQASKCFFGLSLPVSKAH